LNKRFSIEKAEWSNERERSYHQDCLDIVYSFGDELRTVNDKVYVVKNGEELEIEKPLKNKTFWFETWLKIKGLYNLH
jgi:hypothetical protein